MLCVAERFGAGASGCPIEWWDRLSETSQAHLLAFERLRRFEHAQQIAAAAGGKP